MVPILTVFLSSCRTQSGKFEFSEPSGTLKVQKGEKVTLRLNFPDPQIDSVVYSLDGEVLEVRTDTNSLDLDTDPYGYGNKTLSAKLYANGSQEIAYRDIQVVPVAPTAYSFEVLNVYPHDPAAFTQGLYYDNGTLYETTGRWGESTLRKVDLATGEVLERADMAGDEFGEGMTVVGDRMYVLTWENNRGHIYDKRNFKQLGSFDYQKSTKGWGLTHDGNRFIKSDGTSRLYFLDPENLTETGSIEVFDDNGSVDSINELEFIDGKVYANLYHGDRDEIVIINPETGVIEGKINFVGLYDGKRAPYDNEMNGIAYKPDTKTLLLTGKLWTKLYEVRLKER
ncbi:glutaminyl-peptide cyclotransferase [Sphingobacterium daejeonense]|jgi:glutamine cyclotransferase|uniref:glutaminyl-peptide cyclotransferase n=1 Tax=Sphingobacterium daejeonense TaxID=371142 RepID=UPI003D313701